MCSRQMAIHLRYLWIVSILIGWASTLYAQGLIPEQVNQIIIYCDLPEATPTFFLVFSSKPIASSIGREELQSLVFSKGAARFVGSEGLRQGCNETRTIRLFLWYEI